MAVGADDVVIGMHATPDVGAGNRLGMAEQAGIEDLLGGHKRKRYRNRIASATGGDMVRPRSVAALAARILGLLLARGNALKVRIAVKVRPNIGVASAADLTSDIIGG